VTVPELAVNVNVYVPGGVGTPGWLPVPLPPPHPVMAQPMLKKHANSRSLTGRYLRGDKHSIPANATTGHPNQGMFRLSDAVAAVVLTETTTVSGLLSGRGSDAVLVLHLAPGGAPLQLIEMAPPPKPNPGMLATITLYVAVCPAVTVAVAAAPSAILMAKSGVE
jgi:hypothetical protein